MKSSAINRAMNILRLLRQITEADIPVSEKLDKIVSMIVAEMKADAGACYVVVDDNYLELFAASGFKSNATHNVSLRKGEGLVGEVAKTKKNINVSDAWKHPQFSFQPEMGEDNYNSFLGVPLIRWGRTIGVLTVQNREKREYQVSEVHSP